MTIQLDAIPYIIGIYPCGLLNLVENLTKLGVSVRKIRAVNLFNTLNCYINYMFRLMQMPFLNPPGTKGFGTHTKHQGGGGGGRKGPPQYLKNEKCYKPETFGGVRSIL